MLCVYVGGRISAETTEEEDANLARIRELSRQVWDLGHAPFPIGWDSKMGADLGFRQRDWYEYDNAWLDRCDVGVFVEEGLEDSLGAKDEVVRMERNGQPVCIGIEAFEAWLAGKAGR